MRQLRTFLFFISLASPLLSFCQDEKIFAFHPDVRMNFMRFDLFTESSKRTLNDTAVVESGRGNGAQLFFAIPYGDDAEEAKGRMGYSFAVTGGYGKRHDKFGNPSGHWIPYELDFGIWGSYMFHRQAEIGFQYLPIGIFGYSTYAFFGSSLSGRVRLWHLQFEATREGDGIFRGCFKPKFNGNPTVQYAVLFLYNKYFFAGVRYLSFDADTSEHTSITNELRFSIGFGPSF